MRPHSDSEVETQPIGTGLFPGSHDFQINNSQLIDFSQNVYYPKEGTYLEHLQKHISEGALHDSLARFPPPRCHPQTREKVLKTITDWVKNPHAHERIMWLNGPAGAGKSAIAQTISGHYSGEQLAASFFFLRNSSDRGAATRLFTTLAWQLAQNIPELLSYIESAIKTEPLFYTKSLDIHFERLIIQPFQKLLRDKPDFCPQKSLVVIDGVDECAPDRDQTLFLRLIGNGFSEIPIPLRFLICSRPEAHIQAAFESEVMAGIAHSVSLNEQFKPDDDTRRYMKDEFARIRTEHKLSPGWPPSTVIEQLVSKSSGQFIYASTVVKFVDDIYDDPRERLDIVLKTHPVNSASPFAALDQLYIQILSQQPNIRLLRDLFTLIIALRNPEIKFVRRRLRIKEEELERKLLRLRSLVCTSHRDITTYHLSLHDFFLDKKRAGKYFIHPIRVTFVRLPKIMSSAREPIIGLLSVMLRIYSEVILESWAIATLVYGIEPKRRTTSLPVRLGILLFLLIQSALMNYFAFVNGLPAYFVMIFSLLFSGLYIERTYGTFESRRRNLKPPLQYVILLSPHITALCLLIYQLVCPPR
ncbi:hypothetical protein F5887DRAFT_1072634 [Amanita rubescens]|nr:hypothetical protein F5887DRAFT_1202230 [Amanita rubescens]KAF8347648.1 hypothetical protein F5887DRAFT_1072634 [Amanita rubescens]